MSWLILDLGSKFNRSRILAESTPPALSANSFSATSGLNLKKFSAASMVACGVMMFTPRLAAPSKVPLDFWNWPVPKNKPERTTSEAEFIPAVYAQPFTLSPTVEGCVVTRRFHIDCMYFTLSAALATGLFLSLTVSAVPSISSTVK